MTYHRTQPIGLVFPARGDRKATYGSLFAFVVAIEQIDEDPSATGDGVMDLRPIGVVLIANGGLPEAQVASGEYRSRVCGRKEEGSGRICIDVARMSSSDARRLMRSPASILQPCRMAIPEPTFWRDIAM